ncbi:hypothetical protein V2J09_018268 [Rumex salicifolius]
MYKRRPSELLMYQTNDQLDDVLTKPLLLSRCEFFVSKLNHSIRAWLVLSLFFELGDDVPEPPVTYYDNMRAKSLSANPVFHSRMKPISLAYYFVHENVQKKTFRVAYVSTNDQLPDVLNKLLLRPRGFCFCSLSLGTLFPSHRANPVFQTAPFTAVRVLCLQVEPFVHIVQLAELPMYQTNDQLANVLTKPLLRQWFESFVSKLNFSF